MGRIVSAYIRFMDRSSHLLGVVLAWTLLAMTLLTSLIVALRYGFNIGSIALQEAVTYLHGTAFMLGATHALQSGSHVRVDILYRRMSRRSRAWVDSLGAILFLLPLCALLCIASWGYVGRAFTMREGSPDPGGLAVLYLLKSLLIVAPVLLALQGVAELLRHGHRLLRPHAP